MIYMRVKKNMSRAGFVGTRNAGEKGVFDFIAPIYSLFYEYQKKHYSKIIDYLQKEIKFSEFKNMIDVGCGTGALCSVLKQKGLDVTGIDLSKKMLNIAMKKRENESIHFIRTNILDGLPFEDNSFDVSIASYVAHGLDEDERKIVYDEMSRITKNLVIIADYNENRSTLISLIEWLEKGDYFNFIKKIRTELKRNFRDMKAIDVSSRGSWYICVPSR
jgi:ubiquinone/menaquinone biosynthesis C-methylase UbiE